ARTIRIARTGPSSTARSSCAKVFTRSWRSAEVGLAQSVTVMEVSPRDGLQNESVVVSTEDKLSLIHRALDAGFRRIEVTSFVHPARVPQMADAEAVCRGLPQRGDVTYAGLILNRRGYDRARATERLQEVGMVVPATDTFGERNQGSRVADSIAVGCEILRDA